MTECEGCDRHDCRERGCIASVGNEQEDLERTALHSSGLALWSAYCDKKMELEDALEEIERLCIALMEIRDGDTGWSDTKRMIRSLAGEIASEALEKYSNE